MYKTLDALELSKTYVARDGIVYVRTVQSFFDRERGLPGSVSIYFVEGASQAASTRPSG